MSEKKPATKKTNKDLCIAWKPEPLLLRLNSCASMLKIWGILTDGERHKIHQRILKLKTKQEKEES